LNTNNIKKRVILIILLFAICSSFNEILFCQPNFKKIFSDNEVYGSIIILDYLDDKYYECNPKRNDSTYVPASTFKILNSLIALESNVISDENEMIMWDGIERDYHKWNTDHNLRSAFKYSVVWFYM
jgi:beta-lactamase class D